MDFKKALRELDAIRNIAILVNVLFDALLVFLILFLVLSLFNFYPILIASIPAFLYFVKRAYEDISGKTLRDVETSHPVLHERLRTAADSLGKENFMVMWLQASLMNSLRNIRVSSFFNVKNFLVKLGYISLMCFLVLIVALFHLQIFDMANFLEDASFRFNLKENLLRGHIPDSLLGRNINIEDLNSDSALMDITNQMELRSITEQELLNMMPQEVFTSSDVSFEESMSKKKRIYIRNYFSKIRSLEG